MTQPRGYVLTLQSLSAARLPLCSNQGMMVMGDSVADLFLFLFFPLSFTLAAPCVVFNVPMRDADAA